MEEYSEVKIYKNKPELTNGKATICINERKYSNPVASRTEFVYDETGTLAVQMLTGHMCFQRRMDLTKV